MFEKIEFKKLIMDWLLDNNLRLFDAFLKSANEFYELSFEENTISDLMIRDGIENRIVWNDRSKTNAELWKFFSNTYFDDHLIATSIDNRKDIYQIQKIENYTTSKTLKELVLRDYDFYYMHLGLER